jgi:hypothetical protein
MLSRLSPVAKGLARKSTKAAGCAVAGVCVRACRGADAEISVSFAIAMPGMWDSARLCDKL